MKKIIFLLFVVCCFQISAQTTAVKLGYHDIKTDSQGNILPWFSNDEGESYDHIVNIVWNFWDTMRADYNGLPYYMNHQVWKKDCDDHRGVGGDQMAMALSSWRQLYAYTGNPRILENMKFIADYYLSHSLSASTDDWANIPYPYNTLRYSGYYDGDMIAGKGFTQPDKAGSFGYELVNMYKLTGYPVYLDAAINIANTLSKHVKPGDNNNSPLPFRVNAVTGKIGSLNVGTPLEITYSYTSNLTGTMALFSELISLGKGNTAEYQQSFQSILTWIKNYPVKTNKWGPFFEDVGLWSDTQINAVTIAQYILDNPQLFPNWKEDSRSILDWVYKELGNKKWEQYGVTVVNEQTDYRFQGNSHTSRQGAAELSYAAKTGNQTSKTIGLRQLNWATYMVNNDGENTYPNGETWMTDGYGDYVRHYLKALAAFPENAYSGQNHMLKSTSVIKYISYNPSRIEYNTFDNVSTEVFRLTAKPKSIIADDKTLVESGSGDKNNSWAWEQLEKGGVIKINNKSGQKVIINF
jgi:hypothetical protein